MILILVFQVLMSSENAFQVLRNVLTKIIYFIIMKRKNVKKNVNYIKHQERVQRKVKKMILAFHLMKIALIATLFMMKQRSFVLKDAQSFI